MKKTKQSGEIYPHPALISLVVLLPGTTFQDVEILARLFAELYNLFTRQIFSRVPFLEENPLFLAASPKTGNPISLIVPGPYFTRSLSFIPRTKLVSAPFSLLIIIFPAIYRMHLLVHSLHHIGRHSTISLT